MYIVAIGWLYVVLLMAITERTAVAGVATFVLYGAGPVSVVMYILRTPARRRKRAAREARQRAAQAPGAAAGSADDPAVKD